MAESTMANLLDLENRFGAHNYAPLPIVVSEASGVWVTDVEGHRFIDCLAGYSALNFGHGHPDIVAAAKNQLDRVTLTSRAFHHDLLGHFCQELCELTGQEAVLPMNSGAEAVETALKVARRWGYRVKGIPENEGTIIVMDGNFHGRTISIISFSNDEDAKGGYGPYTPGFKHVEYGNADALRDAIDDKTIAVLFEPIQGEGGVVIPPQGYLQAIRDITTERGVLMIADEIQSGLGRTGKTFACDHEDVKPDMYVLGKAIGGGIMPLSAIATRRDVMDVITPGSHGSTFGGNPLAIAVGRQVIKMLKTGEFQKRSAEAEARLKAGLEALTTHGVLAVRTRGLWAGVDIDPALATGKEVCKAAMKHGVLMKDTHESTIRFSPPLIISDEEIDLMIDGFAKALLDLEKAKQA